MTKNHIWPAYYDSRGEVTFANKLEIDNRITFYAKLPNWFKIDTYYGTYNSDCSICVKNNPEKNSYYIIETKSNIDRDKLRGEECYKIECTKKHFKELNVDYHPVDSYETFEEIFNSK